METFAPDAKVAGSDHTRRNRRPCSPLGTCVRTWLRKTTSLGWVLWGVGTDPLLQRTWVFKGGTCLKKCFIETYRFSEDLDFTVLDDGPIESRVRFLRRFPACLIASTRSPASTLVC